MDSKYLVLLLPFGSAVSWALIYVLSEKSYQHISVATNLIALGFATALADLLLAVFLKQPINFAPYFTHPSRHLFWIVFAAGIAGAIFAHLSLQNINATYTVLVESAFIVLAPLFAWLFFADRQWDLPTLVGAALILFGIFLVVHDKARQIAARG